MSLSPPQAGAIPLGRMSPSCPAPSCAAQEGTVGMGCPGCRGQPGAGCRVPAGCRKQLEAGDGVSTAAAARPAHAPTLAPLPVSPREMLREELCMWRPAGKIPHGAGGDGVPTTGTGCPPRGRGAHHGDGVPIMGTFSPAASLGDGSEPTWGQRPWRASRWLRRCRLEGGWAALALRGPAGAAQGSISHRRGAAVGCLGQRCRALRGEAEVRDREGTRTLGVPQGTLAPCAVRQQRLT